MMMYDQVVNPTLETVKVKIYDGDDYQVCAILPTQKKDKELYVEDCSSVPEETMNKDSTPYQACTFTLHYKCFAPLLPSKF